MVRIKLSVAFILASAVIAHIAALPAPSQSRASVDTGTSAVSRSVFMSIVSLTIDLSKTSYAPRHKITGSLSSE